MGIPYNRTQVIQTALNLLGFPLIQSIDAGGKGAAALDNLYDVLMAADLSSPNWRFATKTAQLAQIAGVDPNYAQWNIAYQIPVDCLAIWQLWPTIPYEVFGERIWSVGAANGNQPIMIQYRALGTESKMPPAYLMYFCYLLAVTAAPGVIKDDKILEDLKADMVKWRSQAMVVNTQGRPNQGLTNSTWVNSRVAGSFYGTSWTN